MNLSYFTELTTTGSQLFVITFYGIIVLIQMWRMRGDPKVSSAFMWFLIVRHMLTFAALILCSFLIFITVSLFFMIVTCIDVGNFYEDIPKIKREQYRLPIPILKIRISPKISFQLFLFFGLDIVMWCTIMFCSKLFPSTTLWHRFHF